MDRERLMEIIDSSGRFNLPTVELELLADHLIANGIGDITACEKSQEKIEALKAENERLTKHVENSVPLPIRFDMGKGEYLIAWRKRSNAIEITFNKLAEKGVVGRRYYEYPKCDFTEMIVLSLGDEIAFRKFFRALKILKAEAEPFACTEARLKELEERNV